MSRSLLVSSLVCQDTLFLSLIYFFDQMLVCSFWGGGSGLNFFGLVLLTSTATPQRSPEGDHGHVPWPMNGGVHFATETYRTGFQRKDQGEDGDSRRKPYLFQKIFVTNFQFDQVRFFFNVTKVFIFFVVSSRHNRQLGTHTNGLKVLLEAPDSKALPQWILHLRVYAHTCRQTKEI